MKQEKDRSLFGLNFTNHFPQKSNVWIYSLDTPSVKTEAEAAEWADLEGHKHKGSFNFDDEIPVRKRFSTWVVENYERVLTPKQLAFLKDEMGERTYHWNDRAQYRLRIEKKLLAEYFGSSDIGYYRRMEYDVEKLNILRKLNRRACNNREFVDFILKNINTAYINELVYARLPERCFRHLMYHKINPDYVPNVTILNEIFEIILQDMDDVKIEIHSHKSK